MTRIVVTVEDPEGALASGYTDVQLERASSPSGSFSVVGTEPLASGQYQYAFEDPNGTASTWYRHCLSGPPPVGTGPRSVPYRSGLTSRRLVRRRALSDFRAGLVLRVDSATATSFTTADPRVASAVVPGGFYRTSFLLFASGEVRYAEGSTGGTFTFSPALAAPPALGSEVELHLLASPEEWNAAIARGLGRYWVVEAVPLPAGRTSYDLSGFPWLDGPQHVHGLFTLEADGRQRPWFGGGKWYAVQEDTSGLVLAVQPAPESPLVLECTRRLGELPTDDDEARCDEELAAALSYDELLKMLLSPWRASAQEQEFFQAERVRLLPHLRRLLQRHRPRPRSVPRVFLEPPVVPKPFMAR